MIMTAPYKKVTKVTTFLKNHTAISVFYFSAICKKHIVTLVTLVTTDEDSLKINSYKKVTEWLLLGILV